MKEIFDEEKISKYMNNDEAVIVMDKKDFDDNYIHKDKIRDKIKKLEYIYQREEEENGYNDETYMYYIPQIKVLNQLLEEDKWN